MRVGWQRWSIAATLANADGAPLQFLIEEDGSSKTFGDFFLENSSFLEHCQLSPETLLLLFSQNT